MTAQTEASSAPPEILIVEDSLVEATLERRCLERAGYAVRMAKNGVEGLGAVRERRPALVLSDIRMPLMDGYELCREIKRDDELWSLPVILLSVLSEPEDIIEAINVGADGYVIKPFVEANLLERLRSLLAVPIIKKRMGEKLEVEYSGKHHTIAADGQQMLNLLLSVYENTLNQSRELLTIQSQLNLLNKGLDEEVQRRTRALRTLSAGNQALVRATSEEELLRSTVRNIVENGGYCLARISYAVDDPEKTLTRMVSAGKGEDFHPAGQHLTWGDTDGGQVPVARAIRSGKPQVCHDIANDPGFAPWKAAALASGYVANIALPLIEGGRTFGGLSIYSSKADAFDEEESALLAELADDIAYGIANLRARAELQASDQALRESEERLRQAMETARDAIITLDGEGGVVTAWNPASEAIFGYSRLEMIGQPLHEILVPPRFREAAGAGMAHFAATGEGATIGRTMEYVALHRNGTEFPIELSLSAMQIRGKWYATGIARDISARKANEAQIKRLNSALRTLSACNVALVHAQSEKELFQSVCRHIVETGGYLLAWVEYPDGGNLRLGAWFGDEAANRCHAELATRPEHADRCLAAIAFRTRQTQVCNNLHEMPECAFKPLREAGVEAVLALPLLHNDDVHGVLTIFSATPDAFGAAEIKLAEELAGDLAYGIVTLRIRAERDQGSANLRQALEQTIAVIALTLEKRDPYTAGHQQRVAEIATAIAGEMGLPPEHIEGIRFGALIHDIGKIAVPAEILSKPTKLSKIEYLMIQTHPQVGFDIVKGIPFPWPVAQMVCQHHERLDGSGYPLGLKGEEIVLEARILAVADVLEAMAAHRPYRAALGMEAAMKELERGRGTAFDPVAVDTCLRLCREKRFSFGV